VEDTLVVNPERLAKGVAGGTFARLEISKPADDKSFCDCAKAQVVKIWIIYLCMGNKKKRVYLNLWLDALILLLILQGNGWRGIESEIEGKVKWKLQFADFMLLFPWSDACHLRETAC
jgi:hypothetical protein